MDNLLLMSAELANHHKVNINVSYVVAVSIYLLWKVGHLVFDL